MFQAVRFRSLIYPLLMCAILSLPGSMCFAEDSPPSPNVVASRPAKPSTPVLQKSKITFPKVKLPVQPMADTTTITLNEDMWYVVESDAKLAVIASPAKSLRVMSSKGPTTLGGLFVDSSTPGVDEIRTFNGPFVTILRKSKDATGSVDVAFVPVGFTDESAIVYRVLTLTGPQPPPVVVVPPVVVPVIPQVEPTVPVVVAPVGFRVLMIYETMDGNSRAVDTIINSTKIRSYLTSKCAKSPDGTPEWRVWDKDVTVSQNESSTIRELWNSVKPQITSVPKLVIAINSKATVYPLPATESDTLAFLKSIGGE